MNILVFTPYSSMVGGANRSLLMVLDGLKNRYGHKILAVVPAKGVFSGALDKIGIDWITAPIHEVSRVHGKGIKSILRLLKQNVIASKDRKASKVLASTLNEKFDIVYINDNSAYMGGYTAKCLGIPYVWHFRTLLKPGAMCVCGVKQLFAECSKIIAISDGMKNLIVADPFMPKDKVVRIHNGIPVDNAEKSRQSREKGFHFVQCGRITADKGHNDSIKALGILKKQGISDIYLHIVGATPSNKEDDYQRSLFALAKELDVSEQVIFEGTCNNMPEFRYKMNGELMCSYCEPFGRVTLEGMRSGLVVIGSNTGGTPEIICNEENGLLYRQGDACDLAEKIKRVYEDPVYAQNLADNAYAYSRIKFTPESNIEAVNSVICDAAGK